MTKVSVIVPVYNSRPFITGCIESLLAQTLDDVELIFVDDHGTDGSMDLVRELLASYDGEKRIVFGSTVRNCGPGGARNAGIALAGGEYVSFVDSDDKVDPRFCEKLYSAAKSAGADLCCCDITVGGRTHKNPSPEDRRFFLRNFVTYCVTFIFRKDFLDAETLRFPASRNSEDTCFLTSCVLVSRRGAKVDEALYTYVDNGMSVSKKRNRGKAHERIRSFRALDRFCRERGLWKEYFPELLIVKVKKNWAMVLKDIVLG